MRSKYLVFLFTVTLFSSCVCTKLYFEDNEKYWTDIYKKDDILIFQANTDSSKNGTIFILDKKVFLPKGDCNVMVSNTDPEGCVIDYKYKHGQIESDSDYFVQHFKDEDGISLPVLRVYGTEFSGDKLKDTVVVTKQFGKLIDCHTFHRYNTYNGWSEFKIKTFVWNKRYGLVMFEGINDEKYELVKIISK